MKKIVFEKIKKHVEDLRRSQSIVWMAKSIISNPNVIFITDLENGKQEQLIKMIEILGGELTNETELLDINSDFTGLNKKGKPIVFDSYIVIH